METDHRTVSKPSRRADCQAMDDRKRNSGENVLLLAQKIRKEAYSQMNDRSNSLPAVQEIGTVAFAEVPMTLQQDSEISFSFQPAVVIKTSCATVAMSNEVSDRLLAQILQEVSHA